MGKQKRSENTYQKIQTVFKRDGKNVNMPYDELTDRAFEYLRTLPWRCEEKIDGTNIRLEVTSEIVRSEPSDEGTMQTLGAAFSVDYKGKTDNANVPPKLMQHLTDTYPAEKVLASLGLKAFIPYEEWAEHKWQSEHDIPERYTIYGEGYGAKIQKAGGNYLSNGNGFIVFDVKVDDLYLMADNRNEISEKLGAPIVPFIGMMTLDEAIAMVREGFKSRISENKDFTAEGLVIRTEIGLRNRRGERIITKIKHCDLEKYKAVYGTLDKVEQHVNEHIG
jgi:hypothetical protein